MRSTFIALAGLFSATTVLASRCKPSPSSSSTVPSPSASVSLCPNLLLNPDFTSNAGYGNEHWDVFPGGNGPYYNYGGTTDCGTGADAPAQCFQLYTTLNVNGDVTISQSNIPVTAGTTYTLTFRFRVAVDREVEGMTVKLNDDVVDNVSFLDENLQVIIDTWRDVTVTWTAPLAGSSDYPDTSVATLSIIVPNNSQQALNLNMVHFFMNTCLEGSPV